MILGVAVNCGFSGSLGSRMMMKNLRQEGFEIGRDKTRTMRIAKIRRLMKSLQLKVKQKRKFKVTTDSNHKLPVATNVLNREFSPSAPNQAWGSDGPERREPDKLLKWDVSSPGKPARDLLRAPCLHSAGPCAARAAGRSISLSGPSRAGSTWR